MSLDTNLHGRLRNTTLPASNGLLPLFEAIVNSIHGIEDAGLSAEKGCIVVQVIRDGQMELDFGDGSKQPEAENKGDIKGDIIGFKVTDNGIGFNDANMKSFMTLDSEYKASRGGRGVGRLLWLKAFKCATVESIYETDNTVCKSRSFTFDARQGISEPDVVDVLDGERLTTVHLSGFVKRYRDASPKTARVIAKNLLEHCLWYFVRPGGAPKMEIKDDEERISLDDVYEEQMLSRTARESINLIV